MPVNPRRASGRPLGGPPGSLNTVLASPWYGYWFLFDCVIRTFSLCLRIKGGDFHLVEVSTNLLPVIPNGALLCEPGNQNATPRRYIHVAPFAPLCFRYPISCARTHVMYCKVALFTFRFFGFESVLFCPCYFSPIF